MSDIVRRIVTVNLENGLHMVPCSEIAKFVARYPGTIVIRRDEIVADARSVLDLLQLKAEQGTELTLEAGGDGAVGLVDGLEQLFKVNFEVNR